MSIELSFESGHLSQMVGSQTGSKSNQEDKQGSYEKDDVNLVIFCIRLFSLSNLFKAVTVAVWRTYCCSPAALVVMPPAGKQHQPDESHDEAEDGHEHDPTLRVGRHHQRTRHQDPHQTAEDLQEHRDRDMIVSSN